MNIKHKYLPDTLNQYAISLHTGRGRESYATCIGERYVMDRVKIELTHCYGIKSLQKEFDFSIVPAYAIYAANGVMKTSLAETFKRLSEDKLPEDRYRPERKTSCKVLDETGKSIKAEQIYVVPSYDENSGITEKTSVLLVDHALRIERENIDKTINTAKQALLAGVQAQSKSKKVDFDNEISLSIMKDSGLFLEAMRRVKPDAQDGKPPLFENVEYAIIFNEKVMAELNKEDFRTAIEEFITRYNELLEASTYFRQGIFDYYI